MSKGNYNAWHIDLNRYTSLTSDKDRLRFLVGLGILAPSSHNSQPWEFTLEGTAIDIHAQVERALPISDENNRQLFISLGCALENILTAASAFGLTPTLNYHAQGAGITFPSLSATQTLASDHLIHAIPARSTNRNPYLGPVSEDFLSTIKNLWTPDVDIRCPQVFAVSEPEKKKILADAVLGGLGDAMDDPKFRAELSNYVIHNLSSKKTGMPAFGLGIPTPPSFFVPTVLKYVNVHKLSRRQEEKLLKEQTPVFGIIATQDDNPEVWMKAGQMYQRIALMAHQAGLKTAVMAAAIQIGDYHKVLQNTLDTQLRPQVFFRLGKCDTLTPHSPRLSAEEVLKK